MVDIDKGRFERRLKALYEGWRVSQARLRAPITNTVMLLARPGNALHAAHAVPVQDGGLWGDANALAVAVGSVSEAITYTKSSSLHLWLLGYEFTGEEG